MKRVYTTGEVARICEVAPRTVATWFDQGHLQGYRVPGSPDRRIPHDQPVAFLRAHNMPMDRLPRYYPQDVLVVSSTADCYRSTQAALRPVNADLRVVHEASGFLAACRIADEGIACVVVDTLSIGEQVVQQIVDRRCEGSRVGLPCIGIFPESLLVHARGFEVVLWPYDPLLLAHRITRRVEEYHAYLSRRSG